MIALRFIAVALCWFQCINVMAQSATHDPSGIQTSADKPVILVIGDSLSAEYGLRRDSGWVTLLQKRLDEEGLAYQIQNASISGDTTSGGLSRLPDALTLHHPVLVIIELGSNDALRGLSLDMTETNLDKMVDMSRSAGAQVLLLGMQIPPNYGPKYTEQFRMSFVNVAEKYGTGLVPFLMEGVAMDRSLFQADGIHPNEQAQPRLTENVWTELRLLLTQKTP